MRIAGLMLLVCVFVVVPQTTYATGDAVGLQWQYVDNDNKRVTLSGTILSVKWNLYDSKDNPLGDNDLNLYIMPDDQWYSTNSRGRVNPENHGFPAGNIETEVVTIPNLLDQFFPVGWKVEAHGAWVEDSGHRCKTELHPLMSLIGWDTDMKNFSIFATQDFNPGRYWAEVKKTLNQTKPFIFPINLDPVRDELSLNTYSGGTKSGTLLREQSILGYEHSEGTASYAIVEPSPSSQLALYIALHPSQPDEDIYPWYLGSFSYGSQVVFRDEIKYEKVQQPSGALAVKITLTARSVDPSIEKSVWTLIDAGGMMERYERLSPASHVAAFERLYSPASGAGKTSWTLGVYATNKRAFQPPAGNWGYRRYLYSERTYSIEPSSMQITVNALERPLRDHPRDMGVLGTLHFTCDPKKWSFTATPALIPSVSLVPGSFLWEIRDLQQKDTVAPPPRALAHIPRSLWLPVFPGQKIDKPGFTAEIDPVNPYTLLITFKFLSGSIVARASAETDIGERISVSDQLDFRCSGWHEDTFWAELMKGMLAIQKLEEMGLLPDPTDPQHLFDDPDRFFRVLPKRASFNVDPVPYIREPYKLEKKLRGPVRTAFIAAHKLLSNRSLTDTEKVALARVMRAAHQVTWKTAPTKGQVRQFLAMPKSQIYRSKHVLKPVTLRDVEAARDVQTIMRKQPAFGVVVQPGR